MQALCDEESERKRTRASVSQSRSSNDGCLVMCTARPMNSIVMDTVRREAGKPHIVAQILARQRMLQAVGDWWPYDEWWPGG
jgi:hypothetical protein